MRRFIWCENSGDGVNATRVDWTAECDTWESVTELITLTCTVKQRNHPSSQTGPALAMGMLKFAVGQLGLAHGDKQSVPHRKSVIPV